MSTTTKSDWSIRRILGWLHLWVGMILCVPLVMLGVTGSVLVFQHELAEWVEPSLHRASPGEARPIVEIIAAARALAPPETRPGFYFAPEHAGESVRVRFAAGGRQAQGQAQGQPMSPAPAASPTIVYVDPVTLTPLGARQPSSGLLRQLRMLHANLLTPDRTGREIIGWLGVVMLLLGVSGLVLWWPRGGRWAPAFLVKRGASGVRLHRDLHGAVGIWGWLVFIAVSFSGVHLAFPQQFGAAISSVVPARDLRATANAIRATPVKDARPIDIDAAVALARGAFPDGLLRSVAMPQRPDQPYRVALARPGDGHGTPTVQVFIDPFARTVLELRDPRAFTAGETFIAWQHAVHAGEGLGWLWRILVFLSGLLPMLFTVTGISMWWLKRRARRAATVARQVPAE